MIKKKRSVFFPVFIFVLSFFSIISLTATVADAALTLTREAQIYSNGYSSSPVVGDVNNDGVPEIIFGSRYTNYAGGYGYLQIVQKKADNSIVRLLTKNMGGIPRTPALGDVDKDGIPEIVVFVSRYFGNSGMRVEVLRADGSIVWSTPINDYGDYYDYYGDYPISIGDVNGDSYPDVVALSLTQLHVLDGRDGSVIWEHSYTPDTYGTTAVLNLDGEGGNEVIYGHSGAGKIYVYHSDGTLWWTASGGDFAAADLELDGRPEIITKTGAELLAYSYDGALKWSMAYPFGVSALSGPAAADLDNDGYPEIAVAVSEYIYPGSYLPRKNYVVAVGGSTGTGTEKWRSALLAVGEFDNPSLTCTDLDGNGTPEVTVISDDVAAMVLDGYSGTLLWRSSFDIDENEHSPVIADVDNDGHAEIISPGGTGVPYIQVLGDDIHFVATRSTWNQMSYSYSNVRADLSITDDYMPWITHNTWRTQLPQFVNEIPIAEAGPDQTVQCTNPAGASVLLDGSGSSDPDSDALTYAWTWLAGSASGMEPAVTLSHGATVVTLLVDDGKGGKATDSTTIKVVDTIPGLTSAAVAGVSGANNWYASDVNVTLTAADGCTGVKEIHYTVNAVNSVAEGDAASFLLNKDGSYLITYWSIDLDGNIEQPKTLTINIDKTAPGANISLTSGQLWPPNHKMVNVAVSGGATDGASGIASILFTVTDEYGRVEPSVSGFNTTVPLEAWREGSDMDGRHYTITAVITDKAGNTTSVSTEAVCPHDMRDKN